MSRTHLSPRRAAAASSALALVALATVATTLGSSGAAQASNAAQSSSSGPDHVFVIMMENHGTDQIIGNNADAPYINSLASRYNVETNYHGVTHPSLPEYLAAISGSFQGIWDDCKAGDTCAPEEFVPDSGDGTDEASLTPAQIASASSTVHMFGGKTIVDQLESSGRSWKAYMQSMPSVGYQGEYYPDSTDRLYAQKHNPFMYFSGINSPGNPRLNNVVPFENNFSADLASGHVPSFAWISPDQCHDMHGMSPAGAAQAGLPTCGYPDSGLDHGAIKLGDDYLKTTVNEIMDSTTWKTTKSSIVIMWDENDYSGFSGGPGSPVGADGVVLGGGDAPMLVINSSNGPQVTSDKPADEYTVLSTIEQLWHLGCLENTCSPTTSGTVTNLFRG